MALLAGKSPETLKQWACWLAVMTVGWNLFEGAVAVGSGIAAGSVALVGLGLNARFGWSWADPLAALLIAGFMVHEGWEAVTTRDICCDD